MADVRPFRALRYDTGRTGGLSAVAAPPWDIIGPEEQARLLRRSPWNVARVTAKDADPAAVSDVFRSWVADGILRRDGGDRFYWLRHRFSAGGGELERLGLFGLLALEPFESGNVIPHERIFERFRDNRYRLLERSHADFEPVFMLHRDPDGVVRREIAAAGRPLDRGELDGQSFEMGAIDDPAACARISAFFAGRPVMIADGHHRYQACLRYGLDHPEEPGAGRVLAYFADLDAPELLILPTHRYVPDAPPLGSARGLDRLFDVVRTAGREETLGAMAAGGRRIGVRDSDGWAVLILKDDAAVVPFLAPGSPSSWRLLDTAVLHEALLKGVLGLPEPACLFDAHAEPLLAERDASGRGSVFLLNPVGKDAFAAVVAEGAVMPQKTTYFYPKVPSGLLMYPF